MNSNGILVVALKIGAILILVNALEKFPLSLGYYHAEQGISFTAFMTMSIIPIAVSFIASILMWFFPDLLINKLFNKTSDASHHKIIIPELGHLLISLIGLYILTNSIADFIYHVSFIREAKRQIGDISQLPPQDYAGFIATIAGLFLGFALLFGSKFITYMVLRFQKEMKQ